MTMEVVGRGGGGGGGEGGGGGGGGGYPLGSRICVWLMPEHALLV
jgi:hypothetical protein